MEKQKGSYVSLGFYLALDVLLGSLTVAGCSEVARISKWLCSSDYARQYFLTWLLFSLYIHTQLQYLAFKKHECLQLPVAWLTLESQTDMSGRVPASAPAVHQPDPCVPSAALVPTH